MKNILAFSCVFLNLPSLVAASGFDPASAFNPDPQGAATTVFFEPEGTGCPCLAGTPEAESGCGIPVDTTNGGCNSAPVVTSPLALNQTVCGTAAYDGSLRDTDWYEITITQAGSYSWSVAPEFPAQVYVLDAVCPATALDSVNSTGCGDVATVTMDLVPGTYRFAVAPAFESPFACGPEYTARLTGPPAGSWSGTGALGLDLYGAATTSDGSHVYAAGGYSFSLPGDTTQFARWNPVTGLWAPRATLPIAVNDASLVYGHNGKIYLFGGLSDVTASSATYVYDIALDSWSTGPAMPAARQQMASGYHANWIYLAGGYPDGQVTTPNPALWAFHVPTGTWNTSAEPLPAAFGGAVGAVIDGKFLVAGGRDAADFDRDTLYIYDLSTGGWSSGPNLPLATNVPGGAATEDGELWVYGGGDPFLGDPGEAPSSAPSTTAGCQRYSLLSNSWSACPSMTGMRSFVGSAEIGGRLIAVGGYTGSTTVASSETFTVSAIFIDDFESGLRDEWSGSVP